MAREDFSPDSPVIICGVKDGVITSDGTGVQEFPNFASALEMFPDLDPHNGSKRFTWAFATKTSTRFETSKANDLYST